MLQLYIYICIYIYMLQSIEILRSVTNGPKSDIPDILNKDFTRSTWTIFTFPSLNVVFAREAASRISIGSCFQS